MRRHLTRLSPRALGLALTLFLTLPAVGQAPASVACPVGTPAQAMDLQSAIARSLCHDPRTQQSWAQWQAKAAQLQLERAQAWPTVNASAYAGNARQRLREGGDVTVYRAGVGQAALELSWVLLDFGQQHASQQAAQLSALAAAASHDDVVLEVALATAQAFFALAEAQATVQVLTSEARFTDELLAQNEQRSAANKTVAGNGKPQAAVRNETGRAAAGAAAAGARAARTRRAGEAPAAAAAARSAEHLLGAELERLQLRADQSRAALGRRLARGNLLQARGVLAALLGLPLQHELRVLMDEGAPDAGLHEGAIEPLLEATLRDHPALRAARARLGAAGADLELARRSAAPRITLQHAQRTGRDVLRSNSRDAAVGVQLEVPLFAGFARKHRESLAQAQIDGARAELRGAEQQVALQTWSAYQSFQTHAVAWRQARTHESDAQALLAGELASYRAGNSDLTDVLDAHTTVSDAALARLASLTTWHLARVRLAAALGRLQLTTASASGLTR